MPSPEIRVRAVKRRLRRRKAKRFLFMLPVILLSLLVILFALWMPVLQIHGTSMEPALHNGDSVIVVPHQEYEAGQIIAFRCQGQILTRRIIAGPGSTVEMDSSGNITVDGIVIEETCPGGTEQAAYTTVFPCLVPEGHYFVLCERRSSILDSRSSVIGCVAQENILGQVLWIFLPTDRFGAVN